MIFISWVWHIVIALFLILVAIILLFMIGDAIYVVIEQYMRHCKMKEMDIERSVYNKIAKEDKKDVGENGTKENQ